MRHLAAFAALFSLSTALGQVNENTPGWFAFDMPGLEAPSGTPVDLSGLTTEPAGGSGFLQVKDGHFADGRGQRVRLIGTNITGDSCFMEPETADRLALRLRQWGFNCVRLHFMDFTRKSSIWEDAKTGTLSEDQLKRLDHLVAAFAKNGI
ncbi:MAG: cellulase family glycosylhydrolase, partial [Victivallales bacterium]|nr:cellulase family glycosylhydrolase [Victivallales bacterium]